MPGKTDADRADVVGQGDPEEEGNEMMAALGLCEEETDGVKSAAGENKVRLSFDVN